MAGTAPEILATASCRSPSALRRRRVGLRDRPTPPCPSQHRLCRSPRVRAARPVGAEPTAQARRPIALDQEANRGHLAPGRSPAHNRGAAVRSLELGQIARVPPPRADRPRDQPRAPPSSAEKGGYTLRRVQRKLFSTDPNRRVILHRLRTWWHHRPRGAILAFFDVQ